MVLDRLAPMRSSFGYSEKLGRSLAKVT